MNLSALSKQEKGREMTRSIYSGRRFLVVESQTELALSFSLASTSQQAESSRRGGESWGRMVHEFTSGNMATLK